MALCKILQ